jgi:hypothetical protein
VANGIFEHLALGMDGYDTELMFQSYQDKEPYDPHGYTRDNSFEIRLMVNGIDRDLRDTRTQAQLAALDRKFKAAAPSSGVSTTTRATSRTTTIMAETSGRGQPSVTPTSPTRRTAPSTYEPIGRARPGDRIPRRVYDALPRTPSVLLRT